MKKSSQKEREARTLETFLRLSEIKFDEKELNWKTEEPADLEYKNQGYQITEVSEISEINGKLDPYKTVDKYLDKETKEGVKGELWNIGGNKTKSLSYLLKPESSWLLFIENPIKKKIDKYGKNSLATKNVILLIDARGRLPYFISEKEKFYNLINSKGKEELVFLNNANFKEIYIFGVVKITKIFPLPQNKNK